MMSVKMIMLIMPKVTSIKIICYCGADNVYEMSPNEKSQNSQEQNTYRVMSRLLPVQSPIFCNGKHRLHGVMVSG